MNILKMSAVLVIFVLGVAFVQVAVYAQTPNGVSVVPEISVNVETPDVESSDSGDGEDKHKDNGSTKGDKEAKSDMENENSGDCTTGCPDEEVDNENESESEDKLDDNSEEDSVSNNEAETSDGNNDSGDEINGGETDVSEDGDETDSFSSIFIDSNDQESIAALDAFLKLDELNIENIIDGTSDNGDHNDATSSDNEIDKKAKEIVLIGRKVRKDVEDNNVVVRGWDPEKKEVTISPEDIKKGKDFLDFVGATVLSDKNIESVSLDPQKTIMKYDQPAKLFGFIPINLTAQIELEGKGVLKVKFPWYTFLTKNNAQKVKKEIDVLSLAWGASASGEDTGLQDRARRFQIVNNILKATHDSSTANVGNI